MKIPVLVQGDLGEFVERSSRLSRQQIKNAVPVGSVARILNREGINFVLAGAHGLSCWRKEPRATEDVDVIVLSRYQRKAARVLLGAFSKLVENERESVISLRCKTIRDSGIDVITPKPNLRLAIFKNVKAIQVEKHPLKIPSLEMALALNSKP